jgi:transposase
MTQITIGVDISKDTLDVHRLPDGQSLQFTNDKAGHKALAAWIGKVRYAWSSSPQAPIIVLSRLPLPRRACLL